MRENGDSLEAELTVKGMRLKARLRYPQGDPRRDALVAAFKAGTDVKTAIRPEDIRVGRDETGIAAALPGHPRGVPGTDQLRERAHGE